MQLCCLATKHFNPLTLAMHKGCTYIPLKLRNLSLGSSKHRLVLSVTHKFHRFPIPWLRAMSVVVLFGGWMVT